MTGEEILREVRGVFGKTWSTRAGRQVPEAANVALGNDAVTIQGTVLYADMTDSTELVNGFRAWFAAELYKAYLLGACRIIRNNSGEITAFDGDRVMAVFVGDHRNTVATKAALQVSFLVSKINEMIRSAYPTTSYTLRHSIGIDQSELFIARTGIRNANDLVWVGRAANYAAKLAAISDSAYPIYITDEVFRYLSDEAKHGGPNRTAMWEKRIWTERQLHVHRSNWWWSL